MAEITKSIKNLPIESALEHPMLLVKAINGDSGEAEELVFAIHGFLQDKSLLPLNSKLKCSSPTLQKLVNPKGILEAMAKEGYIHTEDNDVLYPKWKTQANGNSFKSKKRRLESGFERLTMANDYLQIIQAPEPKFMLKHCVGHWDNGAEGLRWNERAIDGID
ncbi:hypothetical protein BDZ94DRAFT_1235225 [Collybia nuda]|uniref:Uncharacterized protein n=1 Tax=Collybia nuda TaxID=64659 RepID=A0A9P6CFZ2_9AGAR|nr:hypothetical protein BDZ94DRAFT_1235225 [Collybia nuda]